MATCLEKYLASLAPLLAECRSDMRLLNCDTHRKRITSWIFLNQVGGLDSVVCLSDGAQIEKTAVVWVLTRSRPRE